MSDRRPRDVPADVTAGGRAVVLLLVACLATAGAVAPAAAGDSATILEVDPETARAPPGETIHVAVVMTSDGGYGGVGVERVAFDLEYDADLLTVEAIHHGPWMAQGNETEVVADHAVDDAAGTVRIEQYRDPAAGGATGHDRVATVAFTVADDADGARSPLNITSPDAELTTDWPVQSFTHNGTVVVEEDADVVDAGPPASSDQLEDGDASDGDGSDRDPVPGFGAVAALAALVALFLAGLAGRRS